MRPLVGRQLEMQALSGLLDESLAGTGSVVGIVGAPGIGKTRLVHKVAAIANKLGVEVHSTFCESHGVQVPFHVLARMIRAVMRLNDLDDVAARAVIEARFARANAEDLLLLEDLTGICDSVAALPAIEPDARRRRLAQMIKTGLLARRAPALYVIKDVHWIDKISEAMFAELFSVIPRTHSMVLLTYRPEYRGPLARMPGSQTIALAPLSDTQAATLTAEMMGSHPSVQKLAGQVTDHAGGIPLFAQEIVRDLVETTGGWAARLTRAARVGMTCSPGRTGSPDRTGSAVASCWARRSGIANSPCRRLSPTMSLSSLPEVATSSVRR
jgi:adenylate cyclase